MTERAFEPRLGRRYATGATDHLETARRPSLKMFVIAAIIVSSGISGAVSLQVWWFSLLPMLLAAILTGLGMLRLPRLGAPTAIMVPIILYFLLAWSSFLFSVLTTSLEFSLRGVTGLLAPIATAIVVATLLKHPAQQKESRLRSTLVGVAVAVITINSVWALRQSLWGFTSAELASYQSGPSTYSVNGTVRSAGLFAINQEFGMAAGCFVPLLLVYALTTRGSRRLVMTALVLTCGALVLHLGRTPLVSAAVASVVAFMLYGPGRGMLLRAVSGAAIAVAVLGTGFFVLSSSDDPRLRDSLARISTVANAGSDVSVIGRTDYVWARAMSLMQDHPFGLGAGTAGPTSATFPELAPAGSVITDQGYLMIGVQLGWLGMAVFAWMLLSIMLWLMRSPATDARAAAMMILSLMVAMLTVQYWSLPAPGLLVGITLGVGISAAISSRSELAVQDSRARLRSAKRRTRPQFIDHLK